MFGKKKNEKELLRAKISTLIGQETVIVGAVQFQGGFHVVGTIKGNVEATDEGSLLIVGENALVTGDIHVDNLIVNGTIEGNVYVKGKVEMFDKAKIVGDVHYGLIELPAGAEVNGKLIHFSAENIE